MMEYRKLFSDVVTALLQEIASLDADVTDFVPCGHRFKNCGFIKSHTAVGKIGVIDRRPRIIKIWGLARESIIAVLINKRFLLKLCVWYAILKSLISQKNIIISYMITLFSFKLLELFIFVKYIFNEGNIKDVSVNKFLSLLHEENEININYLNPLNTKFV
jgi:hypothetical protein